MLQLVSDKTQSLKEFTENNYAQAGFFWNTLVKDREIKVNGKRVGGDCTIYKGDIVRYYLTPKQEDKPAFYPVYEDENFLVVDKESGVNSEAVFAAIERTRECYFIHRLDRNTQGLLAFALNERAAGELLRAFKERRVEKRYHALCFGTMPAEWQTRAAYLKKDAEKSVVKIYAEPTRGSEEIVTEYRALETKEGFSKAEILLHTGKTHQIRAHLSFLGFPIVGDMKYGNSAQNKAINATRQRLIAKSLSFLCDGEFAYINERVFTSRFSL